VECRSFAALGREDDATRSLRNIASQNRARSTLTAGNVLTQCAQELEAHGSAGSARYAARLAVAWFEQRASNDLPARLRADYPTALLMSDDADRAYEAMRTIASDTLTPQDGALMRAKVATFAAFSGRRDEARTRLNELTALDGYATAPAVTAERARAAVALGDNVNAMRLLADALSDGLPYADASTVMLHADYALRGLRLSPAFQRLLQPRG
jgi:hypothetical protein